MHSSAAEVYTFKAACSAISLCHLRAANALLCSCVMPLLFFRLPEDGLLSPITTGWTILKYFFMSMRKTIPTILAVAMLVSSKALSQADQSLLPLKGGFYHNLGVAMQQLFYWVHKQLGKNNSFACCPQLGAHRD